MRNRREKDPIPPRHRIVPVSDVTNYRNPRKSPGETHMPGRENIRAMDQPDSEPLKLVRELSRSSKECRSVAETRLRSGPGDGAPSGCLEEFAQDLGRFKQDR